MRLVTKLVLGVLAATLLSVSAAGAANGDCRLIRGADTPDITTDDVSVCRQDAWIHQAAQKPGNLASLGADSLPSWNTTKPTTSVQGGAGGGYLTNSTVYQVQGHDDTTSTLVVEGSYTGTLDNIAVELYGFVGAPSGDFDLNLKIDGEEIHDGTIVPVKTSTTGTQQLTRFRFVYTNLYKALEAIGKQGDASTVHTLRLAAVGTYVVDDPILFVYDTSEVPAGLVFNLEDAALAPYAVIDLAPEE